MNAEVDEIRRDLERESLRLRQQVAALQAFVVDVASRETGESVLVTKIGGARTDELRWPGYAVLNGVVYVDSNFSHPFASASSITDNSGGAKTWLVLNVGASTVTYEAGPPPAPMPDNQEWYYVSHLLEPPRITRF